MVIVLFKFRLRADIAWLGHRMAKWEQTFVRMGGLASEMPGFADPIIRKYEFPQRERAGSRGVTIGYRASTRGVRGVSVSVPLRLGDVALCGKRDI
jgi:hypothetical protein